MEADTESCPPRKGVCEGDLGMGRVGLREWLGEILQEASGRVGKHQGEEWAGTRGLTSAPVLAFWPVTDFKMRDHTPFRNTGAAELLFPGALELVPSRLRSALFPTKEKSKQHLPSPPFLLPLLLPQELLSSSPPADRASLAFSAENVFGHCLCTRCASTVRTSLCPCLNSGTLLLHSRMSFVGI